MHITALVFISALVGTTAFAPRFGSRHGRTRYVHDMKKTNTPFFMSSPSTSAIASDTVEGEGAPIVVNGQNIELTPAIVDHVNKRIGGPLRKLASNGAVRECDVHLSVSKNPKVKEGHRVEVVTNLKGTTIIVTNESPDMYNSIDSAAHALQRRLRKYKERRTAGWHGGAKMGQDLMDALDALEDLPADEAYEEDFIDTEAPEVTKVNSFDLEKPISLQEAVYSLNYVDHDFYVFRNEDTDKISVVYKRHGGGVGLVEP